MARILIAEHNEATSGYLATTLRKSGNSVETVDNNLEAWKVSSKKSFDILLINIVMPEIDSFALVQKILQDNPALRIVFITGFAGITMEINSTFSYAQIALTSRPFHLNEISSCVCYIMGQGDMPVKSPSENVCDNVVYADFNSKKVACQQISS